MVVVIWCVWVGTRTSSTTLVSQQPTGDATAPPGRQEVNVGTMRRQRRFTVVFRARVSIILFFECRLNGGAPAPMNDGELKYCERAKGGINGPGNGCIGLL